MQTSDTKQINILNGGFVRLIDQMGNDKRVVDAARVSFGKTAGDDEKDKKLIDYLIKNQHFTPFEKIVFEFHVKCPIFVARQWMRHRFCAFNERSGRYTEFCADDYYQPQQLRISDRNNKQGSVISDSEHWGDDVHNKLLGFIDLTIKNSIMAYKALVEQGVAKELARIVLPVAMYTEFYWTVNARSLMNFLFLRFHKNAQSEIRSYAQAIYGLVCTEIPWTMEAFQKHFLNKEN